MKVCVIDDDPLMVEHLRAMLDSLGHEVCAALDVDAGVRLVRSEKPDAVLIDILLPEKDGLNFIMEIRDLLAELRVVAISGGGRLSATALLSMARGLGAHVALTKPFSASELRDALTGQIPAVEP